MLDINVLCNVMLQTTSEASRELNECLNANTKKPRWLKKSILCDDGCRRNTTSKVCTVTYCRPTSNAPLVLKPTDSWKLQLCYNVYCSRL
jgi:hypothetical protein